MPRIGRIKYNENESWYHLYSRVAAHKGVYPLSEPLPMRRLIETVEHFSEIYFCQVAAFCVMGNHYHLVVKFDGICPVSQEELRVRTRLMYPGQASQKQIDGWSDEDWEHYQQRLFDVSEYMRNIQAAFARWYNFTYQRRGRFWADRFKSVYLEDERAVLDCMLYVELNPIRAGITERPEDWHGASLYFREVGKGGWLASLKDFIDQPSEGNAMREYCERLYYRGSVATKGGQRVISQEVLAKEIARGFVTYGLYGKRLGYFVDGLAIGTEAFVRDQLSRLREKGQYVRRRHPIPQLGGIHLSLREQRSTAVTF